MGRTQSAALATRQSEEIIAGSSRDPQAITQKLKSAAEQFHLVSPATVCGTLPEGCEVTLSTVFVNSDSDSKGPGEVYSTGGGKLGLSKATLDQIASASGISWDSTKSGRLDNGSDPRYCLFRAVGYIKNFDGTPREITGTKEMDLRPGSPQVRAIEERVAASNRKKNQNKSPENQIREMQLHILGHAETKARLRAIRSIGIKTGYTAEELKKPFVVARLMWTGRSADPALNRELAIMNARAMLGATNALYGEPSPPPTSPTGTLAPPPVGTVPAEVDDGELIGEPVGEPVGTPVEPPAQAPPPSERRPSQPQRNESESVIPGGREKGTPLSEASDKSLQYWSERIARELDANPDKRFADRDRELLGDLNEEITRRQESEQPEDDTIDRGDDPNAY